MNEKIIRGFVCILVGLLAIRGARAEANLSIEIETTGPVNAWMDVNTNDSVSIIIDNVNWTNIPEYVKENEQDWLRDRRGPSFSNIASLFEEVASLIMGRNKEPNSWHVRIANALLSVFVTRPELQEVRKQNQFLLYRVEALENTMEKIAEEAYCKGKIETMLKYNLTKVKCQNITYFNPAITKTEKIIGIEAAE